MTVICLLGRISVLMYCHGDIKPTFSTNPSHLRLILPTGLPSWQRDWTGPITLIVLFLVSHFNFLSVPCGGLSWLPVSFLLHVKYTLSYRIVALRSLLTSNRKFYMGAFLDP